MIHPLLLTSIVGAVLTTAVSASAQICSQFPYSDLLPLSNYPPAESFCSERFPLKQCTTKTSTTSISVAVTTTSTETSTTTTTTTSSTASTYTATSFTTTITSVTTTGITTITSTTGTSSITTYTATSTICTVDGNAPLGYKRDLHAHIRERDVIDLPLRPGASSAAASSAAASSTAASSTAASNSTALVKRLGSYNRREPSAHHPATTTDKSATQASLLAKLSFQANSFIKTVCDCLETPKPCITSIVSTTTTSTTSVTVTGTSSISDTSVTLVTASTTLSTDTTTVASVQGTTSTEVEATTTINGGATTVSAGCLASCTNGVYQNGGICFNNNCDQSAVANGASSSSTSTVSNLQACVDACANDPACNLYSFDGITGVCTLFDNGQTAGPSNNPGYAYGIYDPSC